MNLNKIFSQTYSFKHTTSPIDTHAASNGEAELAAQILKKCDDPYLAVLMYRSMPLLNGFRPAELLVGHKLQSIHCHGSVPKKSQTLCSCSKKPTMISAIIQEVQLSYFWGMT